MDFLDTIFLDNSIKAYCIVGGSILLMLILKKFLSRYIASLLYRLIHRIWKNVKKKSFVDLVLEPMEWFLLILIAVFAIDKLNFPSQWSYSLYGHSAEQILDRLGIAIIIVSFTWLLLRMVDFVALVMEQKAILTENKSDDQLVVFFRDFLKVIIVIGGLLLIIKACFNQPIGNLLTSLSIVGAVLALAARESLENLIASFIIFFDKPFTTGDTLKVNAVSGTVEKIGLRSTRIRTADKTLVTVPNKQMVDSVVDNWSLRTQRRAEIKLELTTNTAAQKIKVLTKKLNELLASKSPLITSSSVLLKEINKSGMSLVAEYFTNTISLEAFDTLKQEINFAVKEIMEADKIEFAVNALTVAV